MRLRPFTLTHVEYFEEDPIGFPKALISLLPIFVVVFMVSIAASRRDLATIFFGIGQILNEILNYVLKEIIKEPRPTDIHSHAPRYGMPSNHAQFCGFFAAYVCLWGLFSGHWRASIYWRAFAVSSAMVLCVLCTFSRVWLLYHTYEQIAVGSLVGMLAASFWYYIVENYVRPSFQYLVSLRISRLLMLRDCTHVDDTIYREYEITLAKKA